MSAPKRGGSMRRMQSLLEMTLVVVTAGVWLVAQEPQKNPAANNPHLGNRESIRTGMALYRTRCADCHGLDAGGYRGPDLIAAIAGGMTDERLFQTIRKGVPGTEMPPSSAADDDLLRIIAYLRNIGTAAPPTTPIGNADNGARIFSAQCASCHRVRGRGGRLGPDLTRIVAARSRAALTREIRTPSEWIPPNFETVTIVTKDGQRIRGAKKNEDVYSIQVMDVRERIQGFLKANLQEVIRDKTSLMPAFPVARLNDGDLNDLVGYLSTLRRADTSAVPASAAPATTVTNQDILGGLKDPTRWLTYSGNYSGQRHSPLTQITPDNVSQLSAQWTFQTGQLGSFQTTPLVLDGVLYVTGFNNNAWAIDARSGRAIWRYRRNLPDDLKLC